MFKHILIPTDGSDLSRKAILYGVQLAKESGAKVTGLTVAEPYRAGGHGRRAHSRRRGGLRGAVARPLREGDGAGEDGGRTRPACHARRSGRFTTSPIAPSSTPRRRSAAISSSWPRTGGAGSRPCCSAAKRQRCSRTRPFRCWSTAERGPTGVEVSRPARHARAIRPPRRPPSPWRPPGNPVRRRARNCRRRGCARSPARSLHPERSRPRSSHARGFGAAARDPCRAIRRPAARSEPASPPERRTG